MFHDRKTHNTPSLSASTVSTVCTAASQDPLEALGGVHSSGPRMSVYSSGSVEFRSSSLLLATNFFFLALVSASSLLRSPDFFCFLAAPPLRVLVWPADWRPRFFPAGLDMRGVGFPPNFSQYPSRISLAPLSIVSMSEGFGEPRQQIPYTNDSSGSQVDSDSSS